MIDLFEIGLGLLVLAVRLSMVGYNLRHAGLTTAPPPKELVLRGKFIIIIGLLVVSLGLVRGLSNAEGYEMVRAGALTVMLLGLSWVLQGKGKFRDVCIGTGITAGLGVILIIVYLCQVY